MGEESDDDSTTPEPAVRRIDGDDVADSPADGEDKGVGDSPADADTDDADDPSSDAEASVTPPTATDDMFNEIDTRPTLERDSTDPNEPDDEPASSEDISDRGAVTFEDGSPAMADSTDTADAAVAHDSEDPDGAPDDQEMPLADHIEEMVKRLGIVIVVMAAVSGVVFPFATYLINFLWFTYLPGSEQLCQEVARVGAEAIDPQTACARVYHPLAVVLSRLKVATLAGFVTALPLFVYQTYLFMRPGLYPGERRYYLASVPTSLVLASAGMLFAHRLVIPILFNYFVSYSQGATTLAFGLTETFDLIVLMLGAFALVFQIPVFIMLALMMGLVTREWLQTRRLIFWGLFAALAFLFTGDPTGLGPIFVAVTMIVLFEGTLLLAQWTGHE